MSRNLEVMLLLITYLFLVTRKYIRLSLNILLYLNMKFQILLIEGQLILNICILLYIIYNFLLYKLD